MKPIFLDPTYQIGSHLGFEKCLLSTLQSAIQLGFYALQIYCGGRQTYQRSSLNLEDIQACKQLLARYPMKIFIHACLNYNLAGKKKDRKYAWTGDSQTDSLMMLIAKGLTQELQTLDAIGGIGVVVHPGYALSDATTDEAILRISQTLNQVCESKAKILLENCAGEKERIGCTFAQLAKIRQLCHRPHQIAFCIDTAHSFGSGAYSFSSKENILSFFQAIDHLEHVECIHLNDSEVPFNSKKDRHAPLGQGYIWTNLSLLTYFGQLAGERKIPLILETGGVDDHLLLQTLLNVEK